jgi:hypothetical protein
MAIPFRQPSDRRQAAPESGPKRRSGQENFEFMVAVSVRLWVAFRHAWIGTYVVTNRY